MVRRKREVMKEALRALMKGLRLEDVRVFGLGALSVVVVPQTEVMGQKMELQMEQEKGAGTAIHSEAHHWPPLCCLHLCGH